MWTLDFHLPPFWLCASTRSKLRQAKGRDSIVHHSPAVAERNVDCVLTFLNKEEMIGRKLAGSSTWWLHRAQDTAVDESSGSLVGFGHKLGQ